MVENIFEADFSEDGGAGFGALWLCRIREVRADGFPAQKDDGNIARCFRRADVRSDKKRQSCAKLTY